MKKVIVLGVAMFALLCTPMFMAAAAEETTLSGEPVDIACYLTGKSGSGHAACATSCANKGQPIGLKVEADGKTEVYLVLGKGGEAAKDLMAEHMGKQVKATGDVSETGGLKVIEVSKVEV